MCVRVRFLSISGVYVWLTYLLCGVVHVTGLPLPLMCHAKGIIEREACVNNTRLSSLQWLLSGYVHTHTHTCAGREASSQPDTIYVLVCSPVR